MEPAGFRSAWEEEGFRNPLGSLPLGFYALTAPHRRLLLIIKGKPIFGRGMGFF